LCGWLTQVHAGIATATLMDFMWCGGTLMIQALDIAVYNCL
jgi:hypothetical protein